MVANGGTRLLPGRCAVGLRVARGRPSPSVRDGAWNPNSATSSCSREDVARERFLPCSGLRHFPRLATGCNPRAPYRLHPSLPNQTTPAVYSRLANDALDLALCELTRAKLIATLGATSNRVAV